VDTRRLATVVVLGVLGLAFGWIEGAVVVYLRETYAQVTTPLAFPLVPLKPHLVRVEIVREAATMILLATAAWLADRRWRPWIGAFLLLFGVWDLMYYVMLRIVLGWPASLATWDLLFLIPVPWVAPVWAPALCAALFIAAGSYLFLTPLRGAIYRAGDWLMFVAAAGIIIASFLAERRVIDEARMPEQFAVVIYAAGVLLGVGWFVNRERLRRGLS
jgi:hypothetical protein